MPTRSAARLRDPERLEGRQLLAGVNSYDVGFDIGPIAADPARNFAYVVDQTDSRLLVVDTSLGQTVQVAALGGRATSVTVSPNGRRLYVAEPGAFRTEVFALPEVRRIGQYSLAGNPSLIVAGAGARLYGKVTHSQIAQYDAATGVEVTRFSTSFGWSELFLTTAAAGTRLYTRELALSSADVGCEEFAIGDQTPPRLIARHPVPLSNSANFVVDAAARRIFTADGGIYGVGVTNMDTGDKTVWPSATGPYGYAVATREGLDRVWGFNYDGITEYAKDTGKVRATYPGSGPQSVAYQSLAVTANGNLLFASRSPNDPWSSDRGLRRVNGIGFSPSRVWSTPVAGQNPYATSTATVAGNGRVRFDASASWTYESGEAITSYAWSFGDGSFGSGREVDHVYPKAGSYEVKLVVTSSNKRQDVWTKTIDVPAFVTSLSVPRDGHYRIGSRLEFRVTFSDAVQGGAAASLPIRIGDRTRRATYQASESTPNTLVFAYTVASGDWSSSGVGLPATVRLPTTQSITTVNGNPVALQFPPVDTSRILVGVAAAQLDVDGNGVPDMLWEADDGAVVAMLDGDAARSRRLGGGDGWRLGGMGDFNGDGISDPVWYQAAADRYVLRLAAANGELLGTADLGGHGWRVESTVDRTGDGKADLTWRDTASGLTVIWIMDGLTAVSSKTLGGDQDWRLVPTGEDFDANRDGVADVVWRHGSSGTTVLWTIVNGTATSATTFRFSRNWSLVAAGDFDGNGFGDTVWRSRNTGATRVDLMQNGAVIDTRSIGGDRDWRVAAAYDATGDGTTDLFWRDGTGTTVLDEYSGGVIRSRSVKEPTQRSRLFASYDVA